MTRSARILRLGAALIAGALLGGCGIDQGGAQFPSGPSSTGTQGTVLVSGPITGFGSIFVNDLRLETDGAQIVIDGQFATESDLDIGRVIRAVVVEDRGRLGALSIEHEENVVGPVELLDANAGTLSVLGQPVVIDAETRLGATLTGIADIQIDDVIVVSGLPLPSGEIQATFVARAGATQEFQVTGSIASLDAASLTFEIGGLTVDYSQALLLQLATGMPQLDTVVEVRGTDLDASALVATEVRARPFLPGLFTATATSLTDFEMLLTSSATTSSVLDVNFVGYVTASNLPSSISVVDVDVRIDTATVIDGGTVNELVIGRRVQIEGSITSFGQVRADRVKLF
ncbi:MAG: DUF5666 domain-containing protein [Gammaproteobacteria bacterium]|nr:DUF5666 domain-containing protein [Gammaproteobacteria bacterium]MDH3505654.1 DUF5666 domain-containing protein [Gammaproteobacteria bacterium]